MRSKEQSDREQRRQASRSRCGQVTLKPNGSDSVSGVGDTGSATTGGEPEASSEAASTRRPLGTPAKTTEAKPETSKKFEAPHRLQKETFFTHLAGLIALSFWRTSTWLAGHLPAGLMYRIGSTFIMIGYAVSQQQAPFAGSSIAGLALRSSK